MPTMPIGTLIRKMLRQPACVTSKPPNTGPAASAAPPAAPHQPTARLRCSVSGNAWRSMLRELGTSSAAPMPCNALAATRSVNDVATPQAIDASVNTTNPAIKIRFAPKRSPKEPVVRRSDANARVYALTTHCRPLTSVAKLRSKASSATLTTLTSSRTTTKPTPAAARVPRCSRLMEVLIFGNRLIN